MRASIEPVRRAKYAFFRDIRNVSNPGPGTECFIASCHSPEGCLDVSAGHGPDAAALARIGYRVTAIEASIYLRTLAEKLHNGLSIERLDDSLPDLSKATAQGGRYAFIPLSTVWMHISPDDRPKSLDTGLTRKPKDK